MGTPLIVLLARRLVSKTNLFFSSIVEKPETLEEHGTYVIEGERQNRPRWSLNLGYTCGRNATKRFIRRANDFDRIAFVNEINNPEEKHRRIQQAII